MKCTHVEIPGGGTAIVCGSRARPHRCSACRRALSATLQCDWKIGEGKTCDAWICAGCAKEVGPDKHLCPPHQAAYSEWKARREAGTITP